MSATWPTFDDPPSVAFFDVDGTLLAETTSYLFAKLLRQRGLLPRGVMFRALYHGMQHHLGQLNYERLVAFGFQSLAHLPTDLLEHTAQETFDQHVKPRLFVGAEAHVQALQSVGTPVVLVSSSPRFVITPLFNHLGCTDLLTTPVQVVNGEFRGVGPGPACYGAGKLHWAKTWADNQGRPFTQSVAYADNWSDRHLLEQVGRAFVVHPRRKLKRLATQKGWTILAPIRPSGGPD